MRWSVTRSRGTVSTKITLFTLYLDARPRPRPRAATTILTLSHTGPLATPLTECPLNTPPALLFALDFA